MRIDATHEAKITEKRSRFFAVLAPAPDEAAIKKLLNKRKKAVKKAVHHCWAARIAGAGGRVVEFARNDGEVGRPGHKMLALLRHHELEGVVVVSRIFGGVKLGPAGVGRAFKQAAQAVLAEAGLATGPRSAPR